MKKITILMFCYYGEKDILPITLKQVFTAIPKADVFLLDDSTNPLPYSTVSELLNKFDRLHYEKTTFERNKNLNGPECVLGELDCMVRCMDEVGNKDGYVVKMDPDTLLLRVDLVMEALDRGMKWISHNSAKGHFAGMFYLIHRSILEKVKANANKIELPEKCAEDETIGALCYIYAAKELYSWTNTNSEDGPYKFAAFPVQFYNTSAYWPNIIHCSRFGHILTVGNTVGEGMSKNDQLNIMNDIIWAYNNPEEALNKCPEIIPVIEKKARVTRLDLFT